MQLGLSRNPIEGSRRHILSGDALGTSLLRGLVNGPQFPIPTLLFRRITPGCRIGSSSEIRARFGVASRLVGGVLLNCGAWLPAPTCRADEDRCDRGLVNHLHVEKTQEERPGDAHQRRQGCRPTNA